MKTDRGKKMHKENDPEFFQNIRSSNEYLTSATHRDPYLHHIKCNCYSFILLEICAEIDIYIEEGMALIYEEDLESALVHMKNASKKLQVIQTVPI